MGGWVGRWVEEEQAVGMRCCGVCMGGWVGGWVYLGDLSVDTVLVELIQEDDIGL